MGFIVLSGRYVKQSGGYSAFIPETLLPLSPIPMDAELTKLLSDADRALGRLDGVASILPNPDLFVTMYVRQEAVFSSQIEGTQSTLEDILQFEVDPKTNNAPKDVREVVNHVISMNYGLDRLKELPLCLRLIREMHEILLKGARGENRSPGEFRKQQNWVGEKGSTILKADKKEF
jgi:Fic family protein